MIRVSSCSRSYGFCHLHASRLSNVGIPYLLIKRTLASHAPDREKTHTTLTDRDVKAQESPMQERVYATGSNKEIDLEKLSEKILRKLKKRGLTADSGGFTGPVPDGLDNLLGWSVIKAERLQTYMMPEKRKEIEELAAQGDGLSKLRLESILTYEKQFDLKNIKN